MKKILVCCFTIALVIILSLSAVAAQDVAANPAASAAAQGQAAAPNVILKTPSGPIKGVVEDGIGIYRGIPYAEPPLGELRFAPPQDIKPWTDELDCTAFGDIALQDAAGPGLTMSEDCLTLNVWTPTNSADEKLPVYVWIHGGGFAIGSGAEPDYDGANFAKEGIVTVTINYRLNALGFFASRHTYNKYGTTGNWGLLDQIKALEWINANIGAFGGDKNNITIGGESAGSYSVSALITSPLAEGLFQRAIMESGSILGIPGNNFYSKGNLERSIELCRMMGYTFGAKDNAQGLRALRSADANVLTQMSPLLQDFTITPAFMFTPVFDGRVLPKDVYAALKNGRFNKVDLLWGYNGDEGSFFIPGNTDQLTYEMMAARMFGAEKGQAVLERYPVDAEHSSGERTRRILGYGMLDAVMKPYADALANAGKNVYGYKFNYATKENISNGLGAHHGSEIAYAFGNLPDTASGEAKKLSQEMFTRWANFIKTGNPSVRGGAAWPKYNADDAQMLLFDKEVKPAKLPDKEDFEFMEQIMFD